MSTTHDIAVSVRGLSKSYTIAHESQKHTLASEALLHGLKNIGRKPDTETFWALKDVSFDINKGDVVGIIGRNGAGKSTLLKILSRITEPTSGQIDLYGRVGSLLEVGTGFHPELTGRENVYLNGAVLGMSKREITKHFDAIVDFAGVEKFLDTPVKRYSSGMYVRLAFAVAAHLEPEILIVDEVLAVGDADFQKKCLGKMQDVAAHGRTVIFVSHNMGAVNRLCKTCLWMENGRMRLAGPTANIVAAYLLASSSVSGERKWSADDAPGNKQAHLRAVRIVNDEDEVSSTLDIRKPFYVEVDYELHRNFSEMRVAIQVVASDGNVVFTSNDTDAVYHKTAMRDAGMYTSRCQIPGDFLNSGQYSITTGGDIPFQEVLFQEQSVVVFTVEQTGGVSGQYPEYWPGVICPRLSWTVQQSRGNLVGFI